jgi:sterol desaturase/sphingolipid hydroxylase (fatty acid hydroxylase superfamily)
MSRELVIIVSAAVMAAAFVLEVALHWWRRLDYDYREMRTNLAIGAGFLVCGGGWALLTAGAYHAAWAVTPLRFDMTSGWSWLALFVARDFLFYGSHRASHVLPWMWASHHVHHSSGRLNLGTAMRNSWLGGAVDWIFMLPLAFAGFDPLSITTMHMATSAWNFCAHAGTVPRLGPIDVVFVTPRNHRVHHGTRPDEPFCNYGAVLTVWDRLFGTFRPAPRGPLVFGTVPPPERPYDAVYLELAPWRDYLRGLWRRARDRAGEHPR